MKNLFNFSKPFTKEDIFKEEHNQWILKDKYLLRFFSEIFADLSEEDFQTLTKEKSLLFLYCEGQYSSTLPSSGDHNIILIFPYLLNEIFKANNQNAKAIIFHELGHIYHKHSTSNLSEINKQIEADRFAVKYGHKEDLRSFLNQFNNLEAATRKAHLI